MKNLELPECRHFYFLLFLLTLKKIVFKILLINNDNQINDVSKIRLKSNIYESI